MKLDLRQALNASLPWDFSVELDGSTFPTRWPTVGEVAQLQTMGAMPTDELRGFAAALFDGGSKPHLSSLDADGLGMLIAG